MANLKETDVWSEGIYQIEEYDPVLGGAEGIANKQPKQLAARTQWLKKKLEAAGVSVVQFDQLLEAVYSGAGLDKNGEGFNENWLMDSLNLLLDDYALKDDVGSAIQIYATVPDTKKEDFICVERYGTMKWSNTHNLYQSTSNLFELADSIGINSTFLWANGAKVPMASYQSLYTKALDRGLVVALGNWKAGVPFFAVNGDQLQLPYIGDDFLRLCGNPASIFTRQTGTYLKTHTSDWTGAPPVGAGAGGGLWFSNADEMWQRTGQASENPPGAKASIGGTIAANSSTGCITGTNPNALHGIPNGNTWIKMRPDALLWSIKINL